MSDDFFDDHLDADMETAELTRRGEAIARMKRKGVCAHGHFGRVEGARPGDPRRQCYHCDKVFASAEEAYKAYDDFMERYA